ncbi:Mucin-5AC [Rhizoctonia solani]|uniref:Mucin-5AC n=1 Tax=Rhizoctonia solani TaxID=456999 RepID=A0A0K6FT81_9AGAM|nr:Mucin-5AC [Rhizoctonia solani]
MTQRIYASRLALRVPVPTTFVSDISDLPKPVSQEVPDSRHTCPSSGSFNALASTTSTTTHTTHAQVVESALNTLRSDSRPAPSLRTSSTSSRSLPIDSLLQFDVLTESLFELSAQRDDDSFSTSNCNIQASNQSIERDNIILFDCSLLDEVPVEPAPELLSQRNNNSISTFNRSIKASTSLIERNNGIIIDPALQKKLPTESAPESVKRPLNEPILAANEVLPASEERIEPNNHNIIDFSLNHEVPMDSTPDRLTQIIIEPNIALDFSQLELNKLIEPSKNSIIDCTSSSSTVAAEDPTSPHIFAPPDPADSTELVKPVASATTSLTLITVAEPTPGSPAEHQRDCIRPTRQDLPSRADHPDRQTSSDAPRDASVPGTVGPTTPSVRPSSVGSEEEQNRRTLPSVEPTCSSPSKHRHRGEALPLQDPNTGLTACSIAPPRPHTAACSLAPARHTVPVQPVNIHESLTHLSSRLANLRRLSELFQYDAPEEELSDRFEPTRVGCEGGIDPPNDILGNNQQLCQDPGSDPTVKPPDIPGNDSGDKLAVYACIRPVKPAPTCFDTSKLEINNNSDSEVNRCDPKLPEDRSDDAYIREIESEIDANELEIDRKSPEQRPARKPRHSTRSACAYIPIDPDVTSLYSEGDMFDVNSISACESARLPTKHLNSYTDDVPNTRISDSNTQVSEISQLYELNQPIVANFDPDSPFVSTITSDTSASTVCTSLKPEINLIRAHKPPLKEPEPPPLACQLKHIFDKLCPVESENIPNSKLRDVVTGGDTRDISDLEEKLEELLTHLGGLKNSKFQTLIEHDALPWMKFFDLFLRKLLTRHSTFSIEPGIQVLIKAGRYAIMARTLREYLVHLPRTNCVRSTVCKRRASKMKVLPNPAKDNIITILIKLPYSSDSSKILFEYICSAYANAHACCNQDLTTRTCEIQPRMSIDSPAQLLRLIQQGLRNDSAELVTSYAECASQAPPNGAVDTQGEVLPDVIHSDSISTRTLVYRAQESPASRRPPLLMTNPQAWTPQCTYRLKQEPSGALAVVALEAPANRARNDCGMHLIDSIHPGDAPVHRGIYRTFTFAPCEPKPLVKLDPSAQILQRLTRLVQSDPKELADTSEDFASDTIDAAPVPDNLRTHQALKDGEAESDPYDSHLVKQSSGNSRVTHKIRLDDSYITHPVVNASHSRPLKDSPNEPRVALVKRTPRQVSEHTIHGETKSSMDKRRIKQRKKRIKSTHTHSGPDNRAPDILVHSKLRDKDSKDNPY